jgi:predicted porin
MKKSLLIALLVPYSLFSQQKKTSFPFIKKDQFISVQYGFPNTIKNSLESVFGFSQTNKKSFGPLSIAYEYHVNELMSVGVSISYGTYSADYKDVIGAGLAFKGTLRNTALLLQSTKYFESDKKALLYAKGSIGINLWSGEYKKTDGTDFKNFNAPTPLGYNAVVGVKYGFNKNTYGYLEAGYGKYIVAAGLALKLNKQ